MTVSRLQRTLHSVGKRFTFWTRCIALDDISFDDRQVLDVVAQHTQLQIVLAVEARALWVQELAVPVVDETAEDAAREHLLALGGDAAYPAETARLGQQLAVTQLSAFLGSAAIERAEAFIEARVRNGLKAQVRLTSARPMLTLP
jgi:hypothetical protein